MQKIPMNIMALAQNDAQHGSYIVLLKEEEGARRLPIVIGAFEAQAIAVAIEGISPNRPLTHDLFKNTLEHIGINLQEIIVSDLRDGIFYATLICIDVNGDTIEMDSRTSDALALSVRFTCPIFTYEYILEKAGVSWDYENQESQPIPKAQKDQSLTSMSLKNLEEELEKALTEENYEKAARIRDEINKRK
ncbi:MAG: bifunctional nuclease family protein [Bacteroidota bacterium]